MALTFEVRHAVTFAMLIVFGCGRVAGSEKEDTGSDVANATGSGEIMRQIDQDLRMDYVEFSAADIEKTKKFYSEVFGWEFTDYGPAYTSFSDGRLNGGFAQAEEVTKGGPLVVIYAVDLAGTEARIRESGGTIIRETFEFPGGRRFHFTDPSGNELAVWSDK